jgi:hypothetical protein
MPTLSKKTRKGNSETSATPTRNSRKNQRKQPQKEALEAAMVVLRLRGLLDETLESILKTISTDAENVGRWGAFNIPGHPTYP